MNNVLNITNGDSAANIISAFAAKNSVLPWRDPMHHGPFPKTQTLDEVSRVRIAYLEGVGSPLSPEQVHTIICDTRPHSFSERDQLLLSSSEYSETVLWFEHDLLDQLQVLQLLDWFAAHPDHNHNVSIICINQFPGIESFRGIGQLNAEQMQSLYPSRTPVNTAMMKHAQSCWEAFRHASPEALLACISSAEIKNSGLPFLQASLHRHCQEFPWVSDGLSRTERQLMRLVDNGVTSPVQLFVQNMDYESCLYIGDWRTYSHIEALCSAEHPLLACTDGSAFTHARHISPRTDDSTDEFNAQELAVTDFGRQVLEGEASAVKMVQRKEWLGGVYLNSAQSMWYWDDQGKEFVKGFSEA